MKDKPLILVTNDDGIEAKGISALVDAVSHLGDVFVVAPNTHRSGASHSITSGNPLRVKNILSSKEITKYSCTGTPVDCVKIAMNKLLPRKPDIVVSGINHGTNSSVSVLYSGTMGAAIEGMLCGVSSVGFSLDNYRSDADFSFFSSYVTSIVSKLLLHKSETPICLNVNCPNVSEIKGVKVCRHAKGTWQEEYDERQDPYGGTYYWLAGKYVNQEPDSDATDEALMSDGYITIVPVDISMTNDKIISDLIPIYE